MEWLLLYLSKGYADATSGLNPANVDSVEECALAPLTVIKHLNILKIGSVSNRNRTTTLRPVLDAHYSTK